MLVYRIERTKYLETALTGIGAASSGGFRWNSKNTFMVYTSESRALSLLEVTMHLDTSEDLPSDRNYLTIEIPDTVSIAEIKLEDLPENWDAKPPGLGTKFIGDDFILYKKAAVLKVPSCIVPSEYNYLINPNHSESGNIKILETQALQFDQRLKKQH
ncbi:RES family NAD+ phosphorylase [Aquimarina sp. ERC-38]|uniref:RES family NAD+ phosphorylase n=1 Tax=Aquimarina sp. ERC-38 TaxID=2949996 RepID=UPI002246ABD4|nr:RES family NAD+ phosphorylase [Aquimarina sp. ERC-38]UZO81737.1 RES family NAD+ phosphorylase [Aquimarina sp. ERC-38]